jgi:hypothetical protein
MHLEQREMKEDKQIFEKMPGSNHQTVECLAVYRCMKFFIGWMTRFEYPKETFFVSPEQKAHSNL